MNLIPLYFLLSYSFFKDMNKNYCDYDKWMRIIRKNLIVMSIDIDHVDKYANFSLITTF